MKEKEIHNLSKSLDSARSTIKALRYKKSQLKNSKTKLKTGITKIKKVETTKKKVVPISKQKAEDLDENHLNPGALSETSEPESLFLPSMVSHWNPQVMKMYQRPASISSMITHCALFPPGSSFLSMKEVLGALD